MKIIIAGSRHFRKMPPEFINWILESLNLKPTEIVCGAAPGVDAAGARWATNVGKVPIALFPANWELHGNAAVPIRNSEMASYSDALLLVWDGVSRGSLSMRNEMNKLKKPIYEIILKGL